MSIRVSALAVYPETKRHTGCNAVATNNRRGLKSVAGAGRSIELEDRTVTHVKQAKFRIGQIVRHRFIHFGVIFDVDPEFANTEEWWLSIPENVRPNKDQPFYHLLAENAESTYVAYVSEQNLISRRFGRAGVASAGRRDLRRGRERQIPDAAVHQSLKAGKRAHLRRPLSRACRRRPFSAVQ